jgi:hypothetical protein
VSLNLDDLVNQTTEQLADKVVLSRYLGSYLAADPPPILSDLDPLCRPPLEIAASLLVTLCAYLEVLLLAYDPEVREFGIKGYGRAMQDLGHDVASLVQERLEVERLASSPKAQG